MRSTEEPGTSLQKGMLPDVLAVDDKERNLTAIENLLEDMDLRLHVARSGPEALRLCAQIDFAVILLDVQMPEMNGYEVAETLGLTERTRYMPIVFITASEVDRESLLRGYRSGAIDYLQKPIVPQILRSKVRIFLELYEQKRKLSRLNQRMERFVAMVSHDLRSPISSILSMLELVEIEDDPRELKSIAELVSDSATTAMSIVSDLLDLASIETGQIKINPEPFSLNESLGSLSHRIRLRAKEKGIEFTTEVDPDLIVEADEQRIIQVLENLLINALKFTPPEESIILSAKRTAAKEAIVTVTDTGVGIDEIDQPKLFAKDIVHSTRGTAGERGTGYGLPLSQTIIQAHDSSITLKSEPGKGSEFSFTLGLADQS